MHRSQQAQQAATWQVSASQRAPISSSSLPSVVESALEVLQAAAVRRGVRLGDALRDFDRLRTGRVSRAQFLRAMSAATGGALPLSHAHALADAFSTSNATAGVVGGDGGRGGGAKEAKAQSVRGTDEVLYREVVKRVHSVFTEENLERMPTRRIPKAESTLPNARQLATLQPDLEAEYEDLLQVIRHHCRTYGVTVRSSYHDFDRVNRGLVTVSQFARNLPAPDTTEPRHIELLIQKFCQPDTDMVDYMALHRDVEQESPDAAPPLTLRQTLTQTVFEDVPGSRPTANGEEMDVDELIERLRLAFFRTRVRPIEFFRDYDKLRASRVTRNQFSCGLSLACSAPGGIRLNRAEVAALQDRFATGPDAVNYHKFCDVVDKSFLTQRETDLIEDPTAEPPLMWRSATMQEHNPLPAEHAVRVGQLLATVRRRINERRVDPFPDFVDMDRAQGFTKGVTPAQFHRLLDKALGLTLSEADAALLVRRYQDATTGHVNYRAFIADVDDVSPLRASGEGDPAFLTRGHARAAAAATQTHHGGGATGLNGSHELTIGGSIDTTALALNGSSVHPSVAPPRPRAIPAPPPPDAEALVARVRRAALLRGLRAIEAFRDYDRLRKGYITPAQFMSGLNRLDDSLDERALRALAAHYTDAAHASKSPTADATAPCIAWRDFVRDIDYQLQGGRGPRLERAPQTTVAALADTMRSLHAATIREPEERLDMATLRTYDEAMANIRRQAVSTQLELAPPFHDFDPLRKGLVTMAQFRQAIDQSRLRLTDTEIDAVAAYYTGASVDGDDAARFRYRDFLEDVRPATPLENLAQRTTQRLRATTARQAEKAEEEERRAAALEEVMDYLKRRVVQERMRVSEYFRDFDPLRSGRIRSEQLRSGLCMAKLPLQPHQYRTLELEYAAKGHPGFVNFTALVRDIESAFTKHDLHCDPLADVQRYEPKIGVEVAQAASRLSDEEEMMARALFESIAEAARIRRLEMEGDFRDFDKLRRGTITQSQFQRALLELKLIDSSSEEAVRALAKIYCPLHQDGSDVHYRDFVRDVDNAARAIHEELVGATYPAGNPEGEEADGYDLEAVA